MSSYKDYRLSFDTTPEAEDLIFKLLDKRSPAERLQMVSQMNATVRTLAMSGLRERYPHDTDAQLRIRLVELLYGVDIADEFAKKLKNSHHNE